MYYRIVQKSKLWKQVRAAGQISGAFLGVSQGQKFAILSNQSQAGNEMDRWKLVCA